MNWSFVALFLIGAVSTGLYLIYHFKELDSRWHRFICNQFEMHYLCDTLQIGGHCGCCGKWVPDVITRSDLGGFFSGWTLCEECIQSSGEEAKP